MGIIGQVGLYHDELLLGKGLTFAELGWKTYLPTSMWVGEMVQHLLYNVSNSF